MQSLIHQPYMILVSSILILGGGIFAFIFYRIKMSRKLFEYESRLTEAYEKVMQMSKHDPLTKAITKPSMLDIINNEILRVKRNMKSFSIALISIDHYKQLDELYGVDCSDYVMIVAKSLLDKFTREQDIIGRINDEQFLLFLPETQELGALKLAEKIRHHFNNTPIQLQAARESIKTQITITIGLACYRHNEDTLDSLLDEARRCLDKGIKRGSNQVVFINNYSSMVQSNTLH